MILAACNKQQLEEHLQTEVEQEIAKWEAQGWNYEETIKKSKADALYLMHMSSETAETISAFSHTLDGNKDSKEYQQESNLYLVVTMEEPSHGVFSLVFSRAKK